MLKQKINITIHIIFAVFPPEKQRPRMGLTGLTNNSSLDDRLLPGERTPISTCNRQVPLVPGRKGHVAMAQKE